MNNGWLRIFITGKEGLYRDNRNRLIELVHVYDSVNNKSTKGGQSRIRISLQLVVKKLVINSSRAGVLDLRFSPLIQDRI